MRKKTLDDAINEIKQLAKEFRERNGNTALRIPNKNFNLWMVNKFLDQDMRISRVEAKQYAIILAITLVAACLTIFRY